MRTRAAQSRALRVEQTRNGDDRVAVVEERQQLDGARERAQKRLGDSSHAVVACLFRGMKLTGCWVNVVRDFARGFMRDFARGGERVDEFRARALAVRE